MKKKRLFLTGVLMSCVLLLTACGSNDVNNNAIPDEQENNVEQNIDENDGTDNNVTDNDKVDNNVNGTDDGTENNNNL